MSCIHPFVASPGKGCSSCGKLRSDSIHNYHEHREPQQFVEMDFKRVEDREPPAESRCDFCHTHSPTWDYPCKDFSVPLLDSIGHWAACDQCHVWIETGERNKLEMVAMFPFQSLIDLHDEILRSYMQELHDGFFANRTGPAVPILQETNK